MNVESRALATGIGALWLLAGVAGFAAGWLTTRGLYLIREVTTVNKEEETPDIINQRTEDAITIETLDDLVRDSSLEIRQAAMKIVVERVTRNGNYELLLRNVRSRDPEVRDKALKSLRFLCSTSVQAVIYSHATYKVLIDVMESFNSKANDRSHLPDTDWKQRSQPERDVLYILHQAISHSLRETLKAGLVSRWLAKYPFGGPDSSEETKRQIVYRLKTDQTDDNMLGSILSIIDGDPEGRRHLRKFGLIGSAIEEMTWPSANDEAMDMLSRSEGQRRARVEESEEEQALRRRRRQAMVISEGGRPLSRDDIYNAALDNDD